MPHRLCRRIATLLLLASIAIAGPNPGALATARKKINLIQYYPQLGPRVVSFSSAELVELGMNLLQAEVPDAVTEPQLRLSAGGATASMQVDFSKLDRIASSPLSWLLRGPHLVVASIEVSSGNGTMRVHPTEIRIGSVSLTGEGLDYAIVNVLLPYYPDAIVDRDFKLPATINRIQVTPTQALVYRN
ncbi:MAG: hypothetical protein WBW33_03445 [Bryobacteraceae bacterium]